ncbi:MAG: hypothetical protein JNM14_03250 [Ferruginibacter sp.]|nr:hypothetical protein [Ferruginibacter sp.]
MRISFLLPLLLLCAGSFAQKENDAKLYRFTSANTLFPDSARAKGHTYDKVLYPAAIHYTDSTVLIAVPPHFKAGKYIDVIFWFHGWRNNIDSADAYFELTKQFIASKRNAILVFPEGAKNAPDSYGGKLEKKEVFKALLNDVLNKLKTEKVISRKTEARNILLAGHSGAFRVMSYILQNGGVEVKHVMLFDGLYSQVDKYIAWIQADPSHQFINLYTNKGGGTDEVSEKMMQQLREKSILFINPEEKDVHAAMLKTNQVIFIHSLKEHNDVMNRPDHTFRLFIENSNVLHPLKNK